jgi:hypothetical protein
MARDRDKAIAEGMAGWEKNAGGIPLPIPHKSFSVMELRGYLTGIPYEDALLSVIFYEYIFFGRRRGYKNSRKIKSR